MLSQIFNNLPTLRTKRLILRKLLYSDQKDIFNYAKNPRVAEHVLWEAHKTEFDTIQFLNMVYEAYNHCKAAPWGIQLKDSSEIIGTAGFVDFNEDSKCAEVGYALSEDFWGQGIITEAVSSVIEFGFLEMGLNSITARCKPKNEASIRVLEKCSFKFIESVENHLEVKGRLEDINLYSLKREDYFNRIRENNKPFI